MSAMSANTTIKRSVSLEPKTRSRNFLRSSTSCIPIRHARPAAEAAAQVETGVGSGCVNCAVFEPLRLPSGTPARQPVTTHRMISALHGVIDQRCQSDSRVHSLEAMRAQLKRLGQLGGIEAACATAPDIPDLS
jgi:hypothetical protein